MKFNVLILSLLLTGCNPYPINENIAQGSTVDNEDAEFFVLDKIEETNTTVTLTSSRNLRTVKYNKASITKISSTYNGHDTEELTIFIADSDGSEWTTSNMDLRLQILNLIK